MSCTSFCTSPPLDILRDVARSFRHWEIFSEVDHAVQDFDGEFMEAYRSSGMTYSLHSSIANTDIAALNPRMRAATLDEFESEMRFASGAGIDTMTIHPGLICLSVPGCRERSVARANESCKAIEKLASEYGLAHVCIENMPNVQMMLGNTAEELHRIVDGTDLGITFDIGHAHTTSQIDAMVDVFGDRIEHVHIHDNNGDRDAHMTIGEGNIDFRHVMSRLSGYKGLFIIESRSLESAIESQKRLRAMFD